VRGLGGADAWLGWAGRDTAVFSGSKAEYIINDKGYAIEVVDTHAGRDGTDIVYVEKLQFGDGETVDLRPGSETYYSNVDFSAKNAGLFSSGTALVNVSHTFDQLVAKFSGISYADPHAGFSIDGPGALDPAINLDYKINVSDIEVGLPIKLGISSGAFDLSYPINASISVPTGIQWGSSFSVATSRGIVAMPTFSVDGPAASLKVETLIKAKVDADASLTWDIPGSSGTENLFSFHDSLAAPAIELFNLLPDKIDPSGSLYLNHNLGVPTKTAGGANVFHNSYVKLSSKVDSNGLDGTGASILDSNGLYDISATLKQNDSMFNLRFDLDDTAGSLLSFVNPGIGELISRLDSEYKSNAVDKILPGTWFHEDWKTDLTYSIMSINADFGVTPTLKVSFDAQDILVTLT